MNVDWRNRFGWNWITSVRNQGHSQNCWAFAMTALYEAMVRIEHCVWCRRSEGDLARGTGKQSWDPGNLSEACVFAERYGIADPDCFAWGETASLYTATPHGPALHARPVSPTPDRAGRTVRINEGAHVSIVNVSDKKSWIDSVGPMAVMVNPPVDFASLRSGIYIPTTSQLGMPHALLVIGFDDDGKYWIVKNSWGPNAWGVGGFGRIGYNANLLEPVEFIGVQNTSPDPWSKRRLRNGVLVESSSGALHNNFELFIRRPGGLVIDHWYREHAVASYPWRHLGEVRSADPWRDSFHDDAIECPAVVQSTFNRNYELMYPSRSERLRHVYYDHDSGWWNDAGLFGPLNPVGIPGFVQSTRGAPGDFELVILSRDGYLQHWTKHNGAPWTVHRPGDWYYKARFGGAIAFGGPALVQSRLGLTQEFEAEQGWLHYVGTDVNGRMLHYSNTGGIWQLVETFGGAIESAPCMIEGQFGAANELDVGNFELCVAADNQIEHWVRPNHVHGPWRRSAVFGDLVRRVIGFVEGSFGFNLELIVERWDAHYQHYWRDNLGWHAGVIIV